MLHPLFLDFPKETCLYQSVPHRQTESVIVTLEQGPEHSLKLAGVGTMVHPLSPYFLNETCLYRTIPHRQTDYL
jgi:hypothetical protein